MWTTCIRGCPRWSSIRTVGTPTCASTTPCTTARRSTPGSSPATTTCCACCDPRGVLVVGDPHPPRRHPRPARRHERDSRGLGRGRRRWIHGRDARPITLPPDRRSTRPHQAAAPRQPPVHAVGHRRARAVRAPGDRSASSTISVAASARDEADLIGHLGGPLPLLVIAHMLGIDADREADFREWSSAMTLGAPGDFSRSDAARDDVRDDRLPGRGDRGPDASNRATTSSACS